MTRLARRAFLSLLVASRAASALGRRPYGGTLRLLVPWGMSRLDPHELDDPIAALFAHLISDPIFALDAGGRLPFHQVESALDQVGIRGEPWEGAFKALLTVFLMLSVLRVRGFVDRGVFYLLLLLPLCGHDTYLFLSTLAIAAWALARPERPLAVTALGLAPLAYWVDEVGTSNRLTYMLGYPDLGAREKSWAAFVADPAWQQARAESEKDGPLVRVSRHSILRLTPYSPK